MDEILISDFQQTIAELQDKNAALRSEVEWLREALQDAFDAEELSDTHNIIYNALNSFQNGNSSIGDAIAKTRLTYNADTVTLEIKKADRGDYLLIQNLWQYSYYSTLEEAMESYNHKRDLFLGQGYVESEEG